MATSTVLARYEDGREKVVFSDDWSSEEPTATDQTVPAAAITDWRDHTGTWAAVTDDDLRRVFTVGDDPTAVTTTATETPAFVAVTAEVA